MAGITLEEAETTLAAYRAAELKVLTSQAYSFNERNVQRAQLSEIRQGIKDYEKLVKELTARASGRGRGVTINPGW